MCFLLIKILLQRLTPRLLSIDFSKKLVLAYLHLSASDLQLLKFERVRLRISLEGFDELVRALGHCLVQVHHL